MDIHHLFLALALLVVPAASSPGGTGQQEAVGSTEIENAIELVLERMEERSDLGLPRVGDADLDRLHREADEFGKALASGSVSMELPRAMELCGRANYIAIQFLLSGVADSATAEEEIARNARTYFAELFPLNLFGLYCQSAAVPQLEEQVRGFTPEQLNDVRRAGIVKIREGLADQVKGLLMIISDPSVDAARRKKAVDAIDSQADLIGRALSSSQKGEVLELLAEVAQAASLDPAIVKRIATGIEEAKCTSLCR